MQSYVLITGATGGLGKAFAEACAARGWDLFLTDQSNGALACLAAGMQRLHGVEVLYRICDLTDPAARNLLWQQIDDLGLRFHALINVAGIEYLGRFDERTVSEIQTIMRLNIESTVEMTRRVLDYRDPDRRLGIINVSSLAAFYSMPIKAVYAASKRFILDWSLALSEELHAQGVTVTALCPAGLPTRPDSILDIEAQGLFAQLMARHGSDVAAQTLAGMLAGRRVVVPSTLGWLLSHISALFPRSITAHMLHRRWLKRHHLQPRSVRPWTPSASRH